jgi:hypothetical protein
MGDAGERQKRHGTLPPASRFWRFLTESVFGWPGRQTTQRVSVNLKQFIAHRSLKMLANQLRLKTTTAFRFAVDGVATACCFLLLQKLSL